MEEIMNFRQGRMFVMEYALRFHLLSRHALDIVSSMRARIHKIVLGLSPELVYESKATFLIKDIDKSRLVMYTQQVEEEKMK